MSTLAHFAINADDVPRAKDFYRKVFGWTYRAFGPPGFFQVEGDGSDAPQGAIQHRRELKPGVPTVGLECTFAVDDVDLVAREVEAAGGRLLLPRTTIEGVGDLIFFEDTEGNVVGAMRYV